MTLRVLDPIRGALLSDWDARSPIDGLYSHGFRDCPRRRERGPATGVRLWRMLLDFADLPGERQRRDGEYTLAERRELARKVEDLHRRGAPWPRLVGARGDGSDSSFFTPPAREAVRPETRRVRRGYCVRWNGAMWVPCDTAKQRREAGYVALTMRWEGPWPKPGEYLSSGPRARFAYLVAEVRPAAGRRYDFRLWGERTDPMLVPKGATVHGIFWDSRGRKRST